MALLTYNGTNFDTMLGSPTIIATAINVTNAGITSAGVTAPNTSNQINGCWIWVAQLPSNGGNFTVEAMESGVSKALGTINNADIQLGANYVRFPTPYTFATLGASAYTVRVKNTVGTSGQLRSAASGLWFQFSYNLTVATPAISVDNVWVAGFNNAGITPKNLVLTGLLNSWGTAALSSPGSTTQFMGAALTIGSGGIVSAGNVSSTSLNLNGSLFVTKGGLYDFRPPSNKAIVNTTSFDMAATGDQGFFTATGAAGGQILINGAVYDTQTTYGSGLGTAASPLVVQNGWDADVNDEIVVGGGTDYLKNETRRIKTRLSSTQFVLCSTPGGAEVALAHSHAAGAHIGNLTRNSIVKANNNARGFYADNASNEISSFNYSRMEYSECNSGKALTLQRNSLSTIDGLVLCNNPSTGRTTLLMPTNAIPQTNTGIILYNTRGNNYSGQSGIGFQGSSNKTLNNCLHFNGPSSTDTCAFISLNGSSTSNVFNNCHSYGANAGNSSSGYAIGAFSSSGNSFNNCSVNGARQNATYLAIGDSNVFTNCNFGMMANNTVDVANASDSLNKALYENCNFGSTTLITNYLNTLAGTEIVFADMNGTPYNNAIYSTNGLKSTTGPGLADTTLTPLSNRTERLEPLTAPGVKYRYKQLASPAQIFTTYGRLWVNAAALAEAGFVVTVDLYLPGLVEGVDTPSATVTMTKTTTANSANAIYLLSSFYSGTRPRFANIVITAKNPNAIASTYAYVGDILNGTNNITNFSTQDRGAPSEVMFEQNGDPGALAEAARQAILGDTSTWPINSKGNDIMEAAESAELASMK